MKLTYSMLGIFLFLFTWMTVAFLRPVPLDSYQHYNAQFKTVGNTLSEQTAIVEE